MRCLAGNRAANSGSALQATPRQRPQSPTPKTSSSQNSRAVRTNAAHTLHSTEFTSGSYHPRPLPPLMDGNQENSRKSARNGGSARLRHRASVTDSHQYRVKRISSPVQSPFEAGVDAPRSSLLANSERRHSDHQYTNGHSGTTFSAA